MTMTPEQVKFCYATARGYREVAENSLLPQINVVPKEEKGNPAISYNPAIICLALATATPEETQLCIKTLHKLFPKVDEPYSDEKPSNIKEIAQKLIYPKVKLSLVDFLAIISSKITALHFDQINEENSLWILTVARGLDLILKDEYFDDISKDRRDAVEKLLETLNTFVFKATLTVKSIIPETSLPPAKERNQPDVIKHLMAGLYQGQHNNTLSNNLMVGNESTTLNLDDLLNPKTSFTPYAKTFSHSSFPRQGAAEHKDNEENLPRHKGIRMMA